jgi:hypothetical protein
MKKLLILSSVTLFLSTNLLFADNMSQSNDKQTDTIMKLKNKETSNSITIPAGSWNTNENQNHASICKNIGGVDVTNDSDINVGENTLDVVSCKIIDMQKYEANNSNVTGEFDNDSNNRISKSYYTQSIQDSDSLNMANANVHLPPKPGQKNSET